MVQLQNTPTRCPSGCNKVKSERAVLSLCTMAAVDCFNELIKHEPILDTLI